MHPRLMWPVFLLYLLLLGGGVAALAAFVTRPTCSNANCVWTAVLLTFLLLALLSVFLLGLLLRQTERPLRQIAAHVRRVTAGDTPAYILPHNDTAALHELTSAVSDLRDHLTRQITHLEERQRQLALVLHYMGDGVLIVDLAGYVQLLNPAAARLLQTRDSLALGRSYAEVVRHHQLIELYHRCRATAERQSLAFEMGQGKFWQAAVTPFTEQGVHGYLVILRDLTDIRRLETVRRDFISNLSHELRTPLASLRAVMETLQDGALDEPPVAQRFLGQAVHEVDTMTQMVEELLELSRIESGRAPLRLQATAVADLIVHPLERLRSQAGKNRIKVVTDLPIDLPLVLADPPRIEQVISNLLHNAIKFTPANGQVSIRAGLSDEDENMVVLAVEDSGVGIPKGDLPRIFERFYKSDRARTRGQSGTGLGLAIARHLVEAHNGRIWVNSKEGKGSTFYFSLHIAE